MTTELTPLGRNRDFNLLWGSQTLSSLGSNMSYLAFPLLVLAVTGSPVQAGIVGTVAAIAGVATRLPAGVALDRINRRTAMLCCDAARLIAFGGLGVLVLTGHASLILIALAAVVEAVGGAIFQIAEASALPMIVPVEQLADASARNSVRGASTGLIGPPIGGFLFSVASALPFLADALSYLLSFIGIAMIKTPMQKDVAERQRAPILRGLADGFKFAFTQPFLRAQLFIATSFNLAIQSATFCLILALRLNGASSGEIGVAYTILGIGGLAGGFVAGFLRRQLSLLALIRGICWGGVTLLGFNTLLVGHLVSAVPIALIFVLLPAINAVMVAYQVTVTPNEIQGRVLSVRLTVAGGLATLGPVITGLLVHSVSTEAAMIFSAAVMAVGALVASFSKGIRDMRPAEPNPTENETMPAPAT
jgi:predicted MFS family arabinose efflux permease